MLKGISRDGKVTIIDYSGTDTVLNGQTADEWAKEFFEYEYCAECGGDRKDHLIIPFLGNWFAKCKHTDKDNAKNKRGKYSCLRK